MKGGAPEAASAPGEFGDSGLFLPMSREDMERRGWEELDVLLVSGDAYVGSSRLRHGASWALAGVARVQGGRCGPAPLGHRRMISCAMGRPRLFVGVTAGAVDSMLAHYTAFRKKRHDDAYTPGGRAGARPNRAVSVYASLVRRAFPGLPVVAGGIEASLRRVSHYDFWTDSLRKSLLPDARLDLIVYGMGEAAVLDIARRLDAACAANFVDAADILPREEVASALAGIPGTARMIRMGELAAPGRRGDGRRRACGGNCPPAVP